MQYANYPMMPACRQHELRGVLHEWDRSEVSLRFSMRWIDLFFKSDKSSVHHSLASPPLNWGRDESALLRHHNRLLYSSWIYCLHDELEQIQVAPQRHSTSGGGRTSTRSLILWVYSSNCRGLTLSHFWKFCFQIAKTIKLLKNVSKNNLIRVR